MSHAAPAISDPPRKRFLTTDELAAHLGYRQRDSVIRLVHDRGLPARRAGRRYLFDADEVNEWLDGQGIALITATRASAPESEPTNSLDPEWVAEQLAKVTPEDLSRAARVLLALSDAPADQGGAA